MVVVEEGTAWSVGDDEADGEGVVAEEVGEAVDGRGFHYMTTSLIHLQMQLYITAAVKAKIMHSGL